LVWWQPWLALVLFAFLPHFVWEILQAPFSEHMGNARHWSAMLQCTQAAVGDGVITWIAYALAAASVRDRWWPGATDRRRALTIFLVVGLLITAALEWLNVYVRRRWGYSFDMPLVVGIGLTPILQWVVAPLLPLWVRRRHLGFLKDRPCAALERPRDHLQTAVGDVTRAGVMATAPCPGSIVSNHRSERRSSRPA
jgi:hypothetical protein